MAYTTIDDPSVYFQTLLYTGNSSTRSVTNDGNADLQPDWVWTKCRSNASDNFVFDSNRGVHKRLFTNTTAAEVSNTNALTAFNSDGFSMGNVGGMNFNSQTYVAWQWKANGGTTSSNSDGDITSTVQANTTSGFSIVSYTGAASGSSAFTIGHGLGAVPNWIVVKNRSTATNWQVYHSGLSNSGDGPEHCGVRLNTTDAVNNSDTFWADTLPTSSVFTVRESDNVNKNGDNFVAYCFKQIQGYSKFGSYTGNGNADGTFVYTGFKPAWILFKATTGTENWGIFDNRRNTQTGNPRDIYLMPSATNADSAESDSVDFLSNGFKWRIDSGFRNGNGVNFIYMAFAESPFVSSEGVPTTAG